MRIALALLLVVSVASAADQNWGVYGADAGGTRYSPLKQITRENVVKLRVAWTFHTGALEPTPMIYWWNGKQYIVICAGGHGKMKSKMGDSVLAFALE